MNTDYRKGLLAILARLDQQLADADAILADPVDSDNVPMAEELRELLVDMRAKVEAKLDRIPEA